MNNIEFGRLGEEKAIEFLKKKGYKILERNYKTKIGEIDIIAKKNKKIIFIEVKTRSSYNFGRPEESVNEKKLKKIESVAQIYLQSQKINLPYSFEVLSILKDGEKFNFEIIQI